MSGAVPPNSGLALFAPPYCAFRSIDVEWRWDRVPPRGDSVIWWLQNAEAQQDQFEWLCERPPCVPLIAVLPRASALDPALRLLQQLDRTAPRAVLPVSRVVSPPWLLRLLSTVPTDLARSVVRYLARRQILTADRITNQVRRIFELAPYTTSVSGLARRMYISRRTLGRHFEAAGLPVPSHWLQAGRLVHVATRLQSGRDPVFRLACRAGYPDGFTFSNQMKRLFDCRPTEVRSRVGWEWLLEQWLMVEARRGSIDTTRYQIFSGLPEAEYAPPRIRPSRVAIRPMN